MPLWRRKQRSLPRPVLLAARPSRHPQAQAKELAGGALQLTVPVRPGRIARWMTRSGDRPVLRRFELDELGGDLWRMMDGTKTVRTLIEEFGARHQLNLREAEVAVLAYLRTLAERGIMTLLWADEGQDHGKDGGS